MARRSRDVAQSGSAPVLGTGGREFESRRPDHLPRLGESPERPDRESVGAGAARGASTAAPTLPERSGITLACALKSLNSRDSPLGNRHAAARRIHDAGFGKEILFSVSTALILQDSDSDHAHHREKISCLRSRFLALTGVWHPVRDARCCVCDGPAPRPTERRQHLAFIAHPTPLARLPKGDGRRPIATGAGRFGRGVRRAGGTMKKGKDR